MVVTPTEVCLASCSALQRMSARAGPDLGAGQRLRGHLDITSGHAHLISCELFNTVHSASADVISTRRESMKNTMWKKGRQGRRSFMRGGGCRCVLGKDAGARV